MSSAFISCKIENEANSLDKTFTSDENWRIEACIVEEITDDGVAHC